MSPSPKFWASSLAVLVLLTACQEPVAPPPPPPPPIPPGALSDPAALVAELGQFDEALSHPMFQAYNAGLSPQLPRMQPPSPSQLLPDSTLGTTYEWDTDPQRFRYVPTSRTGAPANGVRFILYVEGALGRPAEPRVELGYIDFLDESSDSLRLRIRVQDPAGTVTYFQVAATVVPQSQGFRAAATGTLHTLAFTRLIETSGVNMLTSGEFSLSSPPRTLTASRAIVSSGTGGTIQTDVRLTRPGEVVRIAHVASFPPMTSDDPIEVDATVTVNGGAYARKTGDFFLAGWTKHDNSALSPVEIEALDGLGSLAFVGMSFDYGIESPIATLLGIRP